MIDFPQVKVSDIDINHMLYGNFIGLQYAFKNCLDIESLKRSITMLMEQFPVLDGHFDKATSSVIGTSSETTLRVQNYSDEILNDHLSIGTVQPNRTKFVAEPSRKEVYSGKAALSTFTFTKLQTGCILGIAISHLITDASGFHKIARHLGNIYSAIISGDEIPKWPYVADLSAFKFGSGNTWQETQSELSNQGLKTPVKLGLIPRKMVLWAMTKISTQNRLVVKLTANQVSTLKQTVLKESAEDWISTNAALSAHFVSILVKLIHGDAPKKTLRMGQLLDLRGRYFEGAGNEQDSFIGNAILIYTKKAALKNYNRGSLAQFFKASTASIDAEFLQNRLDVISDCLRHGRTYPGLEFSDPLIAVNNQTKMPIYDLAFNGQTPQRIIPQDVGDNIMFFPAPDGSTEVYIRDILNPKRQAKLETTEWQARIFDF